MSENELSCRELVELVNDYLEGGMSDGERGRFEAHLDECPGCLVYLDQMRATVAATGRLAQDALDPAVLDDLLAAFRDGRRRD